MIWSKTARGATFHLTLGIAVAEACAASFSSKTRTHPKEYLKNIAYCNTDTPKPRTVYNIYFLPTFILPAGSSLFYYLDPFSTPQKNIYAMSRLSYPEQSPSTSASFNLTASCFHCNLWSGGWVGFSPPSFRWLAWFSLVHLVLAYQWCLRYLVSLASFENLFSFRISLWTESNVMRTEPYKHQNIRNKWVPLIVW